tara:strand:- start:982 stop:1296 length:315 start_codon:yes stop_codon:yes gene_type:complete
LTNGISQETNEVCLPEAQIRALFEDAQLLSICEQEKELYKLVVFNRDTTIRIQDELIINLESQVALQDSLMTEMRSEVGTDWYIKYLFLILGIGFTSSINFINN